jgi:hypothetical protein
VSVYVPVSGKGSMQAGEILEACVYADDLEAAERFYTTVLGMEVITPAAPDSIRTPHPRLYSTVDILLPA